MDNLLIDIETYSDEDLGKTGVYRYVESDSFRILLFSYSVDWSPAVCVDLALGEEIPDEIIKAIFDGGVKKYAHNMAFELTCLSKYFGTQLKVEQWWDTMIFGAYLGLPLSLSQLGEVLHLEKQKLKEGRSLIYFFSRPNKGQRRMPADYMDKWLRYKEYCNRDVDTEVLVAKKLLNKVHVPDWEREIQIADYNINKRGVRIDTNLARNAIRFWNKCTAELTEEIKGLTGLENPNSVSQLKGWLAKYGVEVDSLGKPVLKELLESELPDNVRRVLEIRKELGKTSVKKYEAMLGMICKDERARGITQYYGTVTGRWCLTGDHEILTKDGWVRLDEWKGGRIMMWNKNSECLSFGHATANEFNYSGKMLTIDSQRCQQISTPEHKMAYCTHRHPEWMVEEVQNIKSRMRIPFHGIMNRTHTGNDVGIRVLIMVQADGHYSEEGTLNLHFSKQRKVERCRFLLRQAEIPYTEGRCEDGCTNFSIRRSWQPMYLRMFREKKFGWWLLNESPDIIFDELPKWDGYNCGPNSIQYTSCVKQNVEIIQALAVTSGRSATLLTKTPTNKNWSTAYILNVWNTPGRAVDIRSECRGTADYNGKVYCPTTETGFFLVRRNGVCWITGNSGRGIQTQNLPQNHLKYLKETRELLEQNDYDAMDMCYKSIPDTLSQLIRTALVPSKGNIFHVCDFNAIEARVTAWVSGEEWVLDTFREGGDIYCVTATKMFGVPVTKHGEYSNLRQPGKVAVLACGYGGGPSAFDNMAKAYGLHFTEEEKMRYVKQWRVANPHTVKLWSILGDAAVSCINTGNGGTPIVVNRGITFRMAYGFLFITLPSGRSIAYPRAKVIEGDKGPRITYQRLNQTTKKWEIAETWGGKICENCIQSIARDILGIVMLRTEKAGLHVVFHVHDELIVDSPLDRTREEVESFFSEPVPWAPGLPLKGASYSCPYYYKD